MNTAGIVAGLAAVLALSACGEPSAEEISQEQVENACYQVNQWPTDFALVWNATAQRAIPKGESAGQQMAAFVDIGTDLLNDEKPYSDPLARQIIEDYKTYWIIYEQEVLAHGGASAGDDYYSMKLMTELGKYCAQYDPEMADIVDSPATYVRPSRP